MKQVWDLESIKTATEQLISDAYKDGARDSLDTVAESFATTHADEEFSGTQVAEIIRAGRSAVK